MFDGTTPHEQHVSGPARSQRDMVQASLNRDDGRARHDVYMRRLGERREGWRARLAHVERLLADCTPEMPMTWQFGENDRRVKVAQALEAVRAMIDGE
jgi:hypothetical protein